MRFPMINFKGKVKDLCAFTKELCEIYGKSQSIIAVYIMLQRSED